MGNIHDTMKQVHEIYERFVGAADRAEAEAEAAQMRLMREEIGLRQREFRPRAGERPRRLRGAVSFSRGFNEPRRTATTRSRPPCSAASRSGQCVTPRPRRRRSVGPLRRFLRASRIRGNPRETASRITAETDVCVASASASSAAAVAGSTVTRNCFE